MIKLHFLKDYQESGRPRVIFCSEKSLEGNSKAPTGFDLSALSLKAGKAEEYRRMTEKGLIDVFCGVLAEGFDYDALEEMVAKAAKAIRSWKAQEVDVLLPDNALRNWSFPFYKQLSMVGNCFDRYQTSGIDPIDPEKQPEQEEAIAPTFHIHMPEDAVMEQEEEILKEAELMAEGILLARRLVNEPANVMTPRRLAQEASEQAKATGFEIEVFDEKQIQEMGLKAFWSVAMGSDEPPRFMVMRYMNDPSSKEVLAMVGKGITYDSGGYAIKPATGMVTMFCDMGGSAAVIGAMRTLAAMKAKVNVVGIVAACENMISGHAYRNGDIIGSLSGKNIEIVNTDAEGRLTLADGISYAATVIKADKIIDIATLTGAVGIALGDQITGVLSDCEDIWQAVSKASDASGDKVWRLPHYQHLADQNKSERADIKNSGGRPAGTATAGLFCRAFAFGKAWGHLDIAGTAYHEKGSAKAPAGATGVGVELLTRTAMSLFE